MAEERSARVLYSRWGYLILSVIFAVCVLVQVYIAGMATFVDPGSWQMHMSFVHVFEFLLIPMLALAFLGTLPRKLKLTPVLLFGLISMQYATAEGFNGSMVAAIHPVNALIIFWVTVIGIRWARRGLSTTVDVTPANATA